MKMKKVLAYLATAAIVAMVFASCAKDEEFDETLLVGKWLKQTETGMTNEGVDAQEDYWWFKADGTGSSWMEGVWLGVEQGGSPEDNPFTWTLTNASLVTVELLEGGQKVTKKFTVKELTGTYLEFDDDFSKKRTFKKVN